MDKQAAITEGPWGTGSTLSSDLNFIRYITGPDGQDIAKVACKPGMSQDEALANARAIKQVPEMLALLQEAAIMLKGHPEFKAGNSKVHYLAHKTQALLTRVLGQAAFDAKKD